MTKRDGPLVRSPRRLLLAGAGVICVGLAFLGVFLPGLPTTIFLIAASYLFTRSCPWLEGRFFRLRVFRPFLPYVRGDLPLPFRARVTALLMMWGAVTASLVTLALGNRLQPWLATVIVVAAMVGTYCILSFRRRAFARSVSRTTLTGPRRTESDS